MHPAGFQYSNGTIKGSDLVAGAAVLRPKHSLLDVICGCLDRLDRHF
jgi:hypothetical protein